MKTILAAFESDLSYYQRRRGKLGRILRDRGHLQDEGLARALEIQRLERPGVRIGRILVELGLIDSSALYEALCFQNNLPVAAS